MADQLAEEAPGLIAPLADLEEAEDYAGPWRGPGARAGAPAAHHDGRDAGNRLRRCVPRKIEDLVLFGSTFFKHVLIECLLCRTKLLPKTI